jgi:hypothetical protein
VVSYYLRFGSVNTVHSTTSLLSRKIYDTQFLDMSVICHCGKSLYASLQQLFIAMKLAIIIRVVKTCLYLFLQNKESYKNQYCCCDLPDHRFFILLGRRTGRVVAHEANRRPTHCGSLGWCPGQSTWELW